MVWFILSHVKEVELQLRLIYLKGTSTNNLQFVCFSGFIINSGVDIGQYLKKIGFSDGIVSKVTESGMGHVAVAYALYKIATPARYAVTLGKHSSFIDFTSAKYVVYLIDWLVLVSDIIIISIKRSSCQSFDSIQLDFLTNTCAIYFCKRFKDFIRLCI